jgi:catalase
MNELAEQAVDAINDVSGGQHDGHRAAHARGTLCAGTFTPAPQAAELSGAAHFGEPVRVTVRLSNGSGNPKAPDGERTEGRGMAIKFYLPDGSTTDIVSLTLPCFFVRTPEDFVEFVRARKPDPETGQPDMERIGAFIGEHPETGAALQQILPMLTPPRSYATCAFNSIHSFRLGERWARYRIEPEAGVETVPEEEIEGLGPEYLQEDIRERMSRGGVRFTLHAVLAEDGDAVDDPTVPWPAEERERVELGTLELTGLDTSREQDGDVLVFDPTRVTDGIELSGDPILNFRPDAYAVSVFRRTGVKRDG